MIILANKVKAYYSKVDKNNLNNDRFEQISYGGRGDKVRTIRVKDNSVTYHNTGMMRSYKEYSKGNIF